MSSPFDSDFGRRIEAIYKTEDAAHRRRVVLDALALQPGERVVDIGTGPGFVAAEMADRVGTTGDILAIDVSAGMLEVARRRCGSLASVRLESADAREIPAPDASFDVGVSVQVYEYLSDVDAALAELHRVLRPGGRAAIVTTDWRSIAVSGADEELTAKVLGAFAEHCSHQDLPRFLSPKLRATGFDIRSRDAIPQFNPACDPDTYGGHLIGLISSFVSGRGGVTEAEAADWAAQLRAAGDAYFFCLNQYLFQVEKP